MTRKWTDQEILDALKYWAERFGRTPKWSDWGKADPEGLRPTNMTVWSRCGSWTDALVMAGLEPNVAQKRNAGDSPLRKLWHPEARSLRRKGLSDTQIAEKLGVHRSAISKALGQKPKPPRKPRNATEAREARVEALRRALQKEKRETFEQHLKQLRKKGKNNMNKKQSTV